MKAKQPKNHSTLLDDLLSEISPAQQDIYNYRLMLAEKIYAGMVAQKWNQTTFAENAGQHNSVISKWLSGTHNFETDTLFFIQKLLGIELFNLEIASNKVTDQPLPIIAASSQEIFKQSFLRLGKADVIFYRVDQHTSSSAVGSQTVRIEEIQPN